MKYAYLLILVVTIGCNSVKNVTTPFVATEKQNTGLEKSQIDLITNTLSNFHNNSELAIALITDNKVESFGCQRKNDTITWVNNSEKVFEIGSITKVFTTQLLVELLQENKIKSLDESILPYLDFTIKGNPKITFRELADHTSGLPGNLSGNIFTTDASNPYKKWDREKFIKYFEQKVKLDSKPGEAYQYSNVGMALLAYAICQIEKEDFESLLQKNILIPLEMTQTTTKRDLVNNNLVEGYNWKGKPTSNWDMSEMAGAGAMLSTVNDLSNYLLWNFAALNNQLSVMTQPSKSINSDMDVALGWHILKNKTQNPFLWHNGGTGGYKSSMALSLNNQTGVIILSNIGATNNPIKAQIDKLCFDLMKSLENKDV
ncbi:MAG: beta-lactamase family protein [Cyclobacteriaceae bacterium]|nr:beta-lactamase family protein [Cyclobacteriaceae bacterium]